MGVYIDGLDMPKSCGECKFFCGLGYGFHCYLNGKHITFIGEVEDFCPIIEIVTCEECKHRDPEDKKCDCGMFERQGCIFPVADDYFCKYGERRE